MAKFCLNRSLQLKINVFEIDVKNAGIGSQKVQLLKCKIYKYKSLKLDAESTQNADFEYQKMQALHCTQL